MSESQLPAKVEPSMIDIPESDEERVDWIIEQVASNGYEPVIGKPWRGRRQIVRSAAEELAITPEKAEELIEQASFRLANRDVDQERNIQVSLMHVRLKMYLQLLMQEVRTNKVEMTWEWRPLTDEEGNDVVDEETGNPKLVKLPKRETTMRGFDPQTFALLLKVEELIVRLHRLDQETNAANAVAEVFEKFEQNAAGEVVSRQAALSVSQKIKKSELKDIGAAGQEILKRAMASAEGRRKKPVGEES